jgi:transcriptional regulator with XRE-family HTH domain
VVAELAEPGHATSDAEDSSADAKQVFIAHLREVLAANGRTQNALAKRSGWGKSTVNEWLTGKRLPAFEQLDNVLDAGEIDGDVRVQLRVELKRARAHLPVPPDAASGTGGPAAPRRRLPGWLIPTRGVAALVVLALGVGWAAGHVTSGAAGSGDLPAVTVGPPPDTPLSSDCAPQRHWRYQFTGSFRGEVYALVISAHQDTTARLTLRWGAWRWSTTALIQPGRISSRQGGTLLEFLRRSDDSTTPVILDASLPVCAVFGTAADSTKPAPYTVLDTPIWTRD